MRVRGVVAAGVVLALVTGACSGDDDGTDAASRSTTTAATTGPTVAAAAVVRDASVTRNADGTLTVAWEGSEPAVEWSVGWSRSPAPAAGEPIDLAADTSAGRVTITDPAPGERVYFHIVPDGDQEAAVTVAERALPLAGQPNFRDLGGYETADGRHVRWGMLFRAGELGKLTDADLAHLDGVGVKLVCDFRSDGEVELLADRLPAGATTIRLPISDADTDAVTIREQVLAGDLSALDAQLLVDANRSFVLDYTAEYAAMMERIMDPAAWPAVTHCTAGKDRAGFAAAVILWTLGVPTETVMADYLLTNEYRAAENAAALQSVGAIVPGADLEPLRALLDAREEYLQAAIDAIDERYGSVDAYLQDGLGITAAERAAFQDAMLEP